MAEKELDLDTAKQAPAKKKTGKLIMLVVLVMLVLSAGTVGVLYFLSGDTAEEVTETDADPKKAAKTISKAKEAAPQQNKPALYLAVQPALVANFEVQKIASYVQIDMSFMARDQRVIDVAREHMPVIRNNILDIMSAQKVEVVTTRAGKEQLRQAILEAVQQLISKAMGGAGGDNTKDTEKLNAKEKGKVQEAPPQPNIESVYFTSFIIQ